MKQVDLRTLKKRFNECVRLVRAGEHILVTDRGQVIAQLVPPTVTTLPAPAAGFAELERRGLLRPPTTKGEPPIRACARLSPLARPSAFSIKSAARADPPS